MVKDSQQYDAWAAGYDDYVKAADREGRFPFVGHDLAIESLAKTIHGFDPEAEILDLGCGTGVLERALTKLGHHVVGVDFSPEMLKVAREKCPEAEYVCGDLATGYLPDELKGSKFKIITSAYFFHRLPAEIRIAFLDYLNYEVLQDGGLVLLADNIFKDAGQLARVKAEAGQAWSGEDNYPLFTDLKDEIKGLIYQPVSEMCSIVGFKKFQPEVEEKTSAQPIKEMLDSAEAPNEAVAEAGSPASKEGAPAVETKEGTEDESASLVTKHTAEEAAKWRRLRDIPDEDNLNLFAQNLALALQPLTDQMAHNFEDNAHRAMNLFKGYFTRSDIFKFRAAMITTSLNNTVTKKLDAKTITDIAFAASSYYLYKLFPSEKIGVNLLGLIMTLVCDYLRVNKKLRRAYIEEGQKFLDDFANHTGTALYIIRSEPVQYAVSSPMSILTED